MIFFPLSKPVNRLIAAALTEMMSQLPGDSFYLLETFMGVEILWECLLNLKDEHILLW